MENIVFDKNNNPIKKHDKFVFLCHNGDVITDYVTCANGDYVQGIDGTSYHRCSVHVVDNDLK